MAINNADCLVKHTFNKQKLLNMSWYRRLNFLHDLLQSYSNYKLNYSSQLRTRLEEDFKSIWDLERQQKRKLVFYNTITSSFGPEKYIYMLTSGTKISKESPSSELAFASIE